MGGTFGPFETFEEFSRTRTHGPLQTFVLYAADRSFEPIFRMPRIARMAASCLKYVGTGRSRSSQQGPPDFLDMHIVRAATPTKDIHFRMGRSEINVLARQFIRIAFFEMTQLTQGTMIQR